MRFDDIDYRVEDPCAVITLNRPRQLNAFTYQTLREIRAAMEAASADQRVVGIVVTGNGRAFSAGLDAAVLAQVTSDASSSQATEADEPGHTAELPGIFSYFLRVPKPIIAAVNGVAAGGGLILALMSDLRFAAEDASLTTVFLKRGLIAEHGSSWLLPRLVGVGRALDLLWMSDRIDAEEALRIGLVDRVVVAGGALDAARDYVVRLAATSPPAAIAETKRLVYDHLGRDIAGALRDAERSQNRFVAGEDAAEGARAFLQKRPPAFARLDADHGLMNY